MAIRSHVFTDGGEFCSNVLNASTEPNDSDIGPFIFGATGSDPPRCSATNTTKQQAGKTNDQVLDHGLSGALRLAVSLASPRHPSRLCRSGLLIQLRLECGLDCGHVQLGLGPADDDLWGERSVRDHVTLRLLQADGAIGGAGVGAIVGGEGPVHGVDDAVNCVAVAGGDGPGKCGGHGGVVVVGSGVDFWV